MAINGIERIAERILRDAQTEAAGIRAIAEDNCAKIDAQYEKQAKDAADEILDTAEKDAQDLIRRMKGEAEMQARSALLEEKQQLLGQAFSRAREEILNMDESDYRAFLTALICKASVSGEEEIVLSQRDLDRFGQSLCDEVNAALKEAGRPARLTLCQTPSDIAGGCRLRDGKDGSVETNCTLDTLIASCREALVPEVASMLFG